MEISTASLRVSSVAGRLATPQVPNPPPHGAAITKAQNDFAYFSKDAVEMSKGYQGSARTGLVDTIDSVRSMVRNGKPTAVSEHGDVANISQSALQIMRGKVPQHNR